MSRNSMISKQDQAWLDLVLNSLLSAGASFLGRLSTSSIGFFVGTTAATQILPNVAISSLRSTLGSLGITSMLLAFQNIAGNDQPLSLETRVLIAVASSAATAALAGSAEQVIPELVAGGIGFVELMVFLSYLDSNPEPNADETEQPTTASL